MFKIKSVSIKNFLSIGNNTQSVILDQPELVLVLGENLDLGSDSQGNRNGVGKSSLTHAISYAFTGQALTDIKKENLINKTNGKNMLVTVEFEINDTQYRIERGRKPNVLKLFINGKETANTTEEDNSQGDSRETQNYINGILGMNHDMFSNIVCLNTNTTPFLYMKANDQRQLIEQLLGITLLSEKSEKLREQMRSTRDLLNQEEQRIIATQEANKRIQKQIESLKLKQAAWDTKYLQDCETHALEIQKLQAIDIEQELLLHTQWQTWEQANSEFQQKSTALKNKQQLFDKASKTQTKLETEIESLKNNVCYACGQEVHDHQQVLEQKVAQLDEIKLELIELQNQVNELHATLNAPIKPTAKPHYASQTQAVEHRFNLERIQQLFNNRIIEGNPYSDQITELSQQALQTVDFTTINELKRVQEHEEFLLKLLTNKDSFIRKKIIDQNLSYLNNRLRYYLNKMGLPHQVQFENDLSVTISELGREMSYGNLSRGESNRVNLSLSWSFRDVWETLYHKINLMFIDETIDSGMDSAGVENALSILKHMNRERSRSVWLISHKDELTSRVGSVLKVVKEGGFTMFYDERI